MKNCKSKIDTNYLVICICVLHYSNFETPFIWNHFQFHSVCQPICRIRIMSSKLSVLSLTYNCWKIFSLDYLTRTMDHVTQDTCLYDHRHTGHWCPLVRTLTGTLEKFPLDTNQWVSVHSNVSEEHIKKWKCIFLAWVFGQKWGRISFE